MYFCMQLQPDHPSCRNLHACSVIVNFWCITKTFHEKFPTNTRCAAARRAIHSVQGCSYTVQCRYNAVNYCQISYKWHRYIHFSTNYDVILNAFIRHPTLFVYGRDSAICDIDSGLNYCLIIAYKNVEHFHWHRQVYNHYRPYLLALL